MPYAHKEKGDEETCIMQNGERRNVGIRIERRGRRNQLDQGSVNKRRYESWKRDSGLEDVR